MIKKFIITQCSAKDIAVHTNAYTLEEHVYDEVDENLMSDKYINNPEQNQQTDTKDEDEPRQKTNLDRQREILFSSCHINKNKRRNSKVEIENTRQSYEKLNDPHSYEHLKDTAVLPSLLHRTVEI